MCATASEMLLHLFTACSAHVSIHACHCTERALNAPTVRAVPMPRSSSSSREGAAGSADRGRFLMRWQASGEQT
eukprot:350255-Chlamydomonas_euryale.AAC.20